MTRAEAIDLAEFYITTPLKRTAGHKYVRMSGLTIYKGKRVVSVRHKELGTAQSWRVTC